MILAEITSWPEAAVQIVLLVSIMVGACFYMWTRR